MKKYVCKICGYVYDPENNNGVAFEDLPDDWTCPMCGVGKDQNNGVAFEDLPDDWTCPMCGVGKDQFEEM